MIKINTFSESVGTFTKNANEHSVQIVYCQSNKIDKVTTTVIT